MWVIDVFERFLNINQYFKFLRKYFICTVLNKYAYTCVYQQEATSRDDIEVINFLIPFR